MTTKAFKTSIFLLFISLSLPIVAFAQTNTIISMVHYKFEPLQEIPPLPDSLRTYANPVGENYYIVQFQGPILDKWKDAVEDQKGTLFDYINYHAFIVRMDEATRQKVENLDFVRWVGLFHPAYKLDPRLGKERYDTEDPKYTLVVSFFPDVDIEQVQEEIQQLGGETANLAYFPDYRVVRLEIHISPEKVKDLAFIPDVKWIAHKGRKAWQNHTTTFNVQHYGSGTFAADRDTTIWAKGIHGEKQIIGFADTGLDYNHCAFRDPAHLTAFGSSHRKIVRNQAYDTAELYDGESEGHGSHVCGTAAGDQSYINPGTTYDNGMAYKAKISFADVASCAGSFSNFNIITVFSDAYSDGARLHSNSWNYQGYYGDYRLESIDCDAFMWSNKDFLVLFSGGNYAPNQVPPPSTAKDIVSVGASGGTDNSGYLARNENNMTDFSCPGPTDDGRRKPAVTAPGYWIASVDDDDATCCPNCASTCAFESTFVGGTPPSTYIWAGTSMSTPATAGCAALIRQYFMEGWYPTGVADIGDSIEPSAALTKAMLINSADDMTGESTWPTNYQGYGRVNLDNVLYFSGDSRLLQVVDQTTGLATGDADTHVYNVGTDEPFEVVLTWTDHEAAAFADPTLHNDLDLTVRLNGNTYRGNVFASRQSATGGSYDRLNVEEVVMLTSPPAAACTIIVNAYTTPYSPQPYALVVTGDLSVGNRPDAPTLNKLFDNERMGDSTPTFEWNVPSEADGDNLHFKVQWDTDASFPSPTTIESKDNTTGFSPVPPLPEGTGTCSYTVNSQGEGALSNGVTYWWRVAAYDGEGYGAWSDSRSFTYNSAWTESDWFQTTQDQFETDALSTAQTTGTGEVELGSGGIEDIFGPESFEGTWMPIGWQQWDGPGDNSTQTWVQGHFASPNDPCDGVESALINYHDGYIVRRWMVTPSMDFTGYSSCELTFCLWRQGTWDDSLFVHISQGGTGGSGDSWVLLQKYGPADNCVYCTKTIDLSAYDGQSNLHLGFEDRQEGDANSLAFDYVRVQGNSQTDSGTVTSTPVVYADNPGTPTSWDKVQWTETSGDSILIAVEYRSGGGWVDFADTGTVLSGTAGELDISSLLTEDSIRVTGILLRKGGVSPSLADWAVTWSFGPPNDPPVISDVKTTGSGWLTQDIGLTYDITDTENDPCNIDCEWYNGSVWADATVTGTTSGITPPGNNLPITWNSLTDYTDESSGVIKFRIRGQGTGWGDYAESATFDVDNKAPTGATCNTPADGASAQVTSVNLTCNTATDGGSGLAANGYYFELAEDAAFTVGIQNSGWQSGTTWAPTLAAGMHYYWHVRARDAIGNVSTYSTAFDFYTRKYLFEVDEDGGREYTSIVDALDDVYLYWGTTAFDAAVTVDVYTVDGGDEDYDENPQPNTGLNPQAGARLLIKAADGESPVIDASAGLWGILINNIDYVTIRGFEVFGADSDGVRILGSDSCIASYLQCHTNTGDGIHLGTSGNACNNTIIEHDLCYDNTNNGIGIYGNSANTTVKNNTCCNNGYEGLGPGATDVELLVENFDDGNWTVNPAWSQEGATGHLSIEPTGTQYLKFRGLGNNDDNGTYLTSGISTVGYDNIRLRYDMWHELLDFNKWYRVYWSDNSTTVWTLIRNLGRGPTAQTQYTDNLGASAEGISNLRIRFYCDDHDNNITEECFFDNITILGDEVAGAPIYIGAGLYVESATGTFVQNNILIAKSGTGDQYCAMLTESGVTIATTSGYNNYYPNGNTYLIKHNDVSYSDIAVWNGTAFGDMDISYDPLFVNAGADFHIKSGTGSYHDGEWPPLTAVSGTWTNDGTYSPCIDSGYGNATDEPDPNGSITNQGCYGETPQASKSVDVSGIGVQLLVANSSGPDYTTWALGQIGPGTVRIMNAGDRVYVKNTGSVNIDISIQASAITWTYSDAAGADECVLMALFNSTTVPNAGDYSTASDTLGTTMRPAGTSPAGKFAGTTNDGYNISVGSGEELYIYFQAPNPNTVATEQDITITIQAIAH